MNRLTHLSPKFDISRTFHLDGKKRDTSIILDALKVIEFCIMVTTPDFISGDARFNSRSLRALGQPNHSSIKRSTNWYQFRLWEVDLPRLPIDCKPIYGAL